MFGAVATSTSQAEMSLLQIETAWAQDIERVFLALYTVELLLRLAAGGRRNFKSAWFLPLGQRRKALMSGRDASSKKYYRELELRVYIYIQYICGGGPLRII